MFLFIAIISDYNLLSNKICYCDKNGNFHIFSLVLLNQKYFTALQIPIPSLFDSFVRNKCCLSCPFSWLSVYSCLLWMDCMSVCILLHFFSLSFHPTIGRLFWCPIVLLSVILKTLQCHFASDPGPFSSYFFTVAPLALSVHQQTDSFFSSS